MINGLNSDLPSSPCVFQKQKRQFTSKNHFEILRLSETTDDPIAEEMQTITSDPASSLKILAL